MTNYDRFVPVLRPRWGAILALAAGLALLGTCARAHDIYSEWMIPTDPETSCCHDRDCRPTDLCILPDGRQGIVDYGLCREIPRAAILPQAAPDGRPHICTAAGLPPQHIRCVALPGEV